MERIEIVSSPLGRPRDPRIDRSVLAATRELLAEVGYAATSLEAIARRAGTTKPTIYRRWASRAHLIHAAVLPAEEITTADTGSLGDDVEAMIRRARDLLTDPAALAALPGLLAEVSADPSLSTGLLERFHDQVWGTLGARLQRAAADGEARDDVDPTTLVEAIGGTVMMAVFTRPAEELDDAWAAGVARLLLDGVRR